VCVRVSQNSRKELNIPPRVSEHDCWGFAFRLFRPNHPRSHPGQPDGAKNDRYYSISISDRGAVVYHSACLIQRDIGWRLVEVGSVIALVASPWVVSYDGAGPIIIPFAVCFTGLIIREPDTLCLMMFCMNVYKVTNKKCIGLSLNVENGRHTKSERDTAKQQPWKGHKHNII
jgi:hypothetical protein